MQKASLISMDENQRVWNNQHQIHAQYAGQDVHYDIFPDVKSIYIEG